MDIRTLRDLGIELANALLPRLEEGGPDDVAPMQRLWPMRILPGDSETQC